MSEPIADFKTFADHKADDKPEPLTKADYELRTEYVRLSWRLIKQIGPFNFAEQAKQLTMAMSLAIVLGKDEEAFVKTVTDVATEAGFAPKEGA